MYIWVVIYWCSREDIIILGAFKSYKLAVRYKEKYSINNNANINHFQIERVRLHKS